MACEPHKNPLQRSGTSQADRRLPGLSPAYVRIDERRYSDWIVFAVEFSKWLRFYDSASGATLNGWQAFFAKDVSAVLGGFAVQDIESWRLGVRSRLDFLRDDDNAGDAAGLRKRLGEAISAVFTLAKALDGFHLQLAEDLAFKATLRKFIKTRLASSFRQMVGYYKGALSLGLHTPANDPAWKILNRPLADAGLILSDPEAFTAEWWDPSAPSFALIPADTSVFGEVPGSVFSHVSHAANHFLFSSIFDQFTEAFARLIAEAETGLLETLESMDSHKPHYALFLTFLKLFRTGQEQMNGLLWRHLDHYYKDILRLQPKGPEPDHVHLIAELAKSVSAASLPQGALFKAGKDSLGKDVFYALDKETTFNKGEVAELKSVYRVDATDTWQDAGLKASKRYFAAPIMNSADGLGAPLLTSAQEWHPFLNKTAAANGNITAIHMPPARIGFAVASHYLFLAEGARTVKLRFAGTSFASFPVGKLVCYLTHEKGWLEKSPTAVRAGTISGGGGACTEIEIVLAGTDPALVAWNAKAHGGSFNVDVPVAQVILRNEDGLVYGLDDLKNVTVSQVEVHVKVGTDTGGHDQSGAKQLHLANANGALDPSKPFMPWGAVPQKDMPLVLGSKEVFSKRHAAFNVHIEWANRPGTVDPSPGASLQFLEGGAWKSDDDAALTGGKVCSGAKQKTFSADVTVPDEALIDYREEFPGLNPASRAGFMRLVLTGNFGQEAFQAAQLAALIKGASGETNTEIIEGLHYALLGVVGGYGEETKAEKAVKEKALGDIGLVSGSSKVKLKPYLPVINAVYVSYAAGSRAVDLTATGAEEFAARPVRLFHVGPFGEAEQDFPLTGASGHSLLPQFRLGTGGDHLGEWMIGIRNLAPRQSVEVLIQVQEGSTIPTLSKPENHVTWSYWAGNRWVAFEERDLSDGTRQLIQSGIVRFTIPFDAATDKGILPHGHVWVMASVTEAVGAVCKILSVQAQALQATLVLPGVAPDFLDAPLPANTISKLRDADARFKKFAQPHPSFGGRQRETSERFYLRSSERLRHKGRAVTLWDYESLVLEAFPSVYKVKCLNHTRIEDNPVASLSIYNENAPGHVALIAIPSLIGRSDQNPLKPFASQDLLSGIKDYLKERVTGQLVPSPEPPTQVNVHVCNPLFEEIYLEFDLQLREGYDDFSWYKQVLQEEITRHLSPWAFAAEGEAADVQFGGRISKSALINFIEERPYVDFITNVVLKHKPGNLPVSGDLEEAVATSSRSILVSAPAVDHAISQYGTP